MRGLAFLGWVKGDLTECRHSQMDLLMPSEATLPSLYEGAPIRWQEQAASSRTSS
jgi:hypothetical protein